MKNEMKDFEQKVLQRVIPDQKFDVQVVYDADGDCIEFLISNDSFYAERIDSLVTVYYSHTTNQIIGSLIKGVSKFVRRISKKVPGFKIEIVDGRIRLEHLFTAQLWASNFKPAATEVRTYKKLREVAERTNAEALVSCGV